MPVPIIEINVDDKAFKAFTATFNKYQYELKQQPKVWAGVNQGIAKTKETADDFATSMGVLVEAVNKLADAEAVRDLKAQKIEDREKRTREERKRSEEQEAERQRSVLNRVREYSRNVGDIARQGGKWAGQAAEGAFGGLTGGAAGLFGAGAGILRGIPLVGGVLGGLATAGFEAMSNLNNTQRAAHSVGVNAQTLQGWQTTLGLKLPQGAAENLLSTVSEAQSSPGGGGLFGRFGIKDYNNRGVSDMSAEMLEKAQAFLHGHPGAQGMWRAKTLYGGAMDTGTLRTLQGMSKGELDSAIADMKKFAKNNANAEDAATKATNELSSAEQLATGMLDKFAGGMTTALDQVTQSLKSLYDVIQPFLHVQKAWQAYKQAVPHMFDVHSDKPGPIPQGDPRGEVFNFSKSMSGIGKWLANEVGANADGSFWSRADRNNNPGNIMRGNSYNHYATKADGFSAMANQLSIDYNKHGAHSIAALINGSDHPWASEYARGNTHAGTMNYIAHVAKALGVRGDQNIDLNDKAVLARVAKAMYEFESGHKAGMPTSDTGHVAKAVEHAVKSGVMAAHKQMHHGHHIKIKTQSKPGSDTVVSARQLAGH